MGGFLTTGLTGAVFEAALRYLAYVFAFAAVLTAVYFTCRVPEDIFRKLLHFVAFSSTIFIVLTGAGWRPVTLMLLVFAAIIYPVLTVFEHWKHYSGLLVEKGPGEVKRSMVSFYLSQAVIAAAAWGLLGRAYIHVAATAAWGFGDAAAALVGGRLGKHRVKLARADQHKTWEGSAAMAAAAFLAVLVTLLVMSEWGFAAALVQAILVAAAAAYTELVSRNGVDTVTVPMVSAAILALAAVLG